MNRDPENEPTQSAFPPLIGLLVLALIFVIFICCL